MFAAHSSLVRQANSLVEFFNLIHYIGQAISLYSDDWTITRLVYSKWTNSNYFLHDIDWQNCNSIVEVYPQQFLLLVSWLHPVNYLFWIHLSVNMQDSRT